VRPRDRRSATTFSSQPTLATHGADGYSPADTYALHTLSCYTQAGCRLRAIPRGEWRKLLLSDQ
jgi:hypothetical protein